MARNNQQMKHVVGLICLCLTLWLVEELRAASPDTMPPADLIKFSGLSPEAAVREMTLPPGFQASLFAGEPDIKQPIAFALDHRGRLWVAEAYTYPIRSKEGQGKDRILVFEDINGDGKFDRRTVFVEGLNLVSGLEVGFGGVWVGAAPYLMFIPITDGNEPKPAGPPEILLDGWGYQDTHETLNSFCWGPDGWLYGCHGVFTYSKVGKPGSTDAARTPVTAGVWRFHPTQRKFELFSEGTSNPWGVDFDEHGQCFIEACVIPHLWFMIQGARYERQGGQHFNPYVYDDIKTIADHFHYAGSKGPHAANGRSDSAGGGHAHAGLMIYQGDSWPEKYRGQIFMNNIHGARINMDSPQRQGSGFIGHHAPDFIKFNDSWSQIINLQSDQDGSVYLIDWYDKNQCHENRPDGHDRSNGRIFKVSYGQSKATSVDLEKLSNETLIELLKSKNEWQVRHARRLLQERGPNADVHKSLLRVLNIDKNPARQLRALWALHATGGLTESIALAQLSSKDEYLRSWAIQLLAEDRTVSEKVLTQWQSLAQNEPSPVVRLYLAAALQRVSVEKRWGIVAALNQHGEDAVDHNLPLMNWYAAEPLAAQDMHRALALAAQSRMPRMMHFTVRRVAAIGTPQAFSEITSRLKQSEEDTRQLDILTGLNLALKGDRTASMPEGWNEIETKLNRSPNAQVRAEMQSLSLRFGSSNAFASLRETLMNRSADSAVRRVALDSLLGAKDQALAPLLQKLLNDETLRGPAIRGLAAYDDPSSSALILKVYPELNAAQKRDALNTLAARVGSAHELLLDVEKGRVPVKELTADIVRQLRNLKDEEVARRVQQVWGLYREPTADKKSEIQKYRRIYQAGGSLPGNASPGRAIYNRICAQCHTLFDSGGKVGPDLTGSNRADLDYILQNIIDPNAVVPNEYRAVNIETRDARNLTGIIRQQDDKSVTLVTANETVTLPRAEIKTMQQGDLSMMPEGLLQPLSDEEVRDLLYYLSRPGQVPLPASSETTNETDKTAKRAQ
jgi:putative membrane-bound dehydrogenase-like protein